ncbi:MAG TPA: hypothetical protein VIN61_13300 [Gammaproteobacteria bacterium]
MLFHASIPADEPERVARFIAALWRGRAYPFPPYPGAYVACAGDERGTLIDVVPRSLEHVPAPGCFAVRTNAAASDYSAAHLAIGTPLGADEILELAAREGWLAQRSDRGGLFGVVEVWIENKFLLELLPEKERRRYIEMLGPARVDASLGNLAR